MSLPALAHLPTALAARDSLSRNLQSAREFSGKRTFFFPSSRAGLRKEAATRLGISPPEIRSSRRSPTARLGGVLCSGLVDLKPRGQPRSSGRSVEESSASTYRVPGGTPHEVGTATNAAILSFWPSRKRVSRPLPLPPAIVSRRANRCRMACWLTCRSGTRLPDSESRMAFRRRKPQGHLHGPKSDR